MKYFKNQARPVFGVVGILVALLILSSTAYGDSLGQSKKWRANNNSKETIKVFWIADGCAGLKPSCKEGSNPDDVPLVCKTKILQPGESSYYKFRGGTSKRKKAACRKDGDWNKRTIDYTNDRKKNGIRIRGDGHTDWYDE